MNWNWNLSSKQNTYFRLVCSLAYRLLWFPSPILQYFALNFDCIQIFLQLLHSFQSIVQLPWLRIDFSFGSLLQCYNFSLLHFQQFGCCTSHYFRIETMILFDSSTGTHTCTRLHTHTFRGCGSKRLVWSASQIHKPNRTSTYSPHMYGTCGVARVESRVRHTTHRSPHTHWPIPLTKSAVTDISRLKIPSS